MIVLEMDASQALPKLLESGFHFRSLETYPRFVGVERDHFVALLETTAEGHLRWSGASGYLVGDRIAVLVERRGQSVFQSKREEIPASPETLGAYHRFRQDLRAILGRS